MFKILKPEDYKNHEALINTLYDRAFMTHLQIGPDTDKKKATHFIAMDGNHEYLGGAWLIAKSPRKLLKDQLLYSEHLKRCRKVWVCGGINLYLKTPGSPDHFLFYGGLYRQLIEHAKSHGIDYLLVHTSYREKENINLYGRWPMIGQIMDRYAFEMCYSFLEVKDLCLGETSSSLDS